MNSSARHSLDVSLKLYEDTHQSEETTTACSSVSGDDDLESGHGLSRVSDIDSSVRSIHDYGNESTTGRSSRSVNRIPPRKSFLMYGDAAPGKLDRRSSTFSLPAHLESKDDGETFQPVSAVRARSTIPEIPVHKPARPGLIRAVSKLGMSSKSLHGTLTGNPYNESIRMKKQQKWQQNDKNPQPNYDFLTIEKQHGDEGSLLPTAKWWHGIFFFSFIALIACVVTLWAPYPYGARMPSSMVAKTPWSTGCIDMKSCICPRETICADSLLSMILLTISRCSAWFDYPLYMVLFLSKCNNLNNYLQKTVLRCFINFSDYHKVHRLFGIIVGVESLSHSLFHLLRWARRNNDIRLLYTCQTGITGLIVLVLSWFIILPMTVPCLKKAMSYEWRKGLHYLAILWAVGLMFHAPQRIFWMMGVPLLLFLADKVIEIFSKTFLVESAHFERLSDNICTITFENPPGFGKQNSAYVYLMLPWISRYQFHAFTVFPGEKPNTSSICINKCGNWTEALMKEISTPTHKPAYVMGPYLSPFSSPAMDSENVVAVASGIGVTPAMSLIKQYSSTSRRMNLIWICRDAALVEHFLQNLDVGADGHLLIYYTGKRPLFLNNDLPPNVCLFQGRPDLEKTISAVILSTASDGDLPDELYKHNSVVTKATPQLSSKLLLEKALSVYSIDQLFDYAIRASSSVLDEDEPPLKNAASFKGVLIMMKNLLGRDCDLMLERILKNLDAADSYGSSVLTRDMFEDFMTLMTEDNDKQDTKANSQVQNSDCLDVKRIALSDVNTTLSNGMFGVKKYLHGEGKYSSKNWKLLYCGGSDAVLRKLRDYKRDYSIGLSVEKFDW